MLAPSFFIPYLFCQFFITSLKYSSAIVVVRQISNKENYIDSFFHDIDSALFSIKNSDVDSFNEVIIELDYGDDNVISANHFFTDINLKIKARQAKVNLNFKSQESMFFSKGNISIEGIVMIIKNRNKGHAILQFSDNGFILMEVDIK